MNFEEKLVIFRRLEALNRPRVEAETHHRIG